MDALVERGLERYSRGEIQEALSDWEHALALDPDCEPARRYIDEVSRHLETLDAAAPEEGGMDELFPLAEIHGGDGGDGGHGGSASTSGAWRVRAADTIDEGWPLVEEVPSSGPPGPENAAAGHAMTTATAGTYQDLRHLTERVPEAAGSTRQARTSTGEDTGDAAINSDTWNDEWTREPTIERNLADTYATAVAQTLDLAIPDSTERLLEVLSELHRASTESDIPVTDLLQPPPESPLPSIVEPSPEPASGDTMEHDLALVADMPPQSPSDLAAGQGAGRVRPPGAGIAPAMLPPVIIEEVGPSSSRPTGTRIHAQGTVHERGRKAGELVPGEPSAREPMRNRSGHRNAGTGRYAAAPADVNSRLPWARELRAALDAEIPTESADDAGVEDAEILRRRVSWLIERAEAECVNDRLEAAITALELAFTEQPDSAVAQRLIHRHLDTLLDIYERYIDNPRAVPVLAISPAEFHAYAIDNRAAFLLSRVDGVLTVEDILDVSGMPSLEAYRYLCSMLCQGILTLR